LHEQGGTAIRLGFVGARLRFRAASANPTGDGLIFSGNYLPDFIYADIQRETQQFEGYGKKRVGRKLVTTRPVALRRY